MVKGMLFIESNYLDFDSAAIKSISRAVLDARAVPSIRGTASIEGHTDSVRGDRYNQLLSLRLTEAVRDYLLSQEVSRIPSSAPAGTVRLIRMKAMTRSQGVLATAEPKLSFGIRFSGWLASDATTAGRKSSNLEPKAPLMEINGHSH